MFPKPKSVLVPNTYEFESGPMVKATGFREYDARWLFGKEINLMGIQALGMGLGTLIHELGVRPEIVTAHLGASCVRFPCVHAVATTPAQRLGVLFALLHPAVSAFPERVVGSACALSFSRLARRSLALRPAHSRCHQFVTR